MIRKSIPAFALGLIGSILLFAGGLNFVICATFVSAASGSALPLAMTIVCFIGASIVGLIGSCLCFKKARVGAILMTVCFVLAIVGMIIVGFNVIALIGMILLLVGVILGFIAKEAK